MDMDAVNHAFELRKAGQTEQALEAFRTLIAVTEDPDDKAGLLMQEASCLAELGQRDEAKAALERARSPSLKPWLSAYADEQEALICMGEGDYEEALRIFDGILSQYPFVKEDAAHRGLFESVQVEQGIILSALGRYEDALKVLAGTLKFELSEHERGTVIYNVGKSFLALKDQEQAKAAFEEVPMVCQDRDCVLPARFNLGMIYANEGRLGSALQEFKWCEANGGVEFLPAGVLYSCLAEVLEAAGVTAEAERYRKMAEPQTID
jgi:tetratricopeptide (TPR) repeat protein